jgi:hypothetical protein
MRPRLGNPLDEAEGQAKSPSRDPGIEEAAEEGMVSGKMPRKRFS